MNEEEEAFEYYTAWEREIKEAEMKEKEKEKEGGKRGKGKSKLRSSEDI